MGWIRADYGDVGVRATAPLRVDCGNALDLDGLSVLLRAYQPATLNIAIGPRVEVAVAWRDDGLVSVDDGTGVQEFAAHTEVALDGSFRLVSAVLHYYRLDGVAVRITSRVPRGMGLGGSGAVTLCLVAACEALVAAKDGEEHGPADPARIALLAQRLEAAVTPTAVGLQDHLAAAFGGASLWTWDAADRARPFRRRELSDPDLLDELDRRLLVALTAEPHVDGGMTAEWAASMRHGGLAGWVASSAATKGFADLLQMRDWAGAHDALDHECRLRADTWPETMTRTANALREAARRAGGAARFAGGGRGGAVWALVAPELRDELAAWWREILGDGDQRLLPTCVEREGLVVEWVATSTSR